MTNRSAGATPDQRVEGTPAPDRVRPLSAGSGERLLSLDFTRGLAVMGILAANIIAFGQPLSAATWPGAFLAPHGAMSDGLWLAQFVLIDGKMRGLFTLLFGAGLILFLDRAWERGQGRGLQARRLFWLLVFGLIHFFLLWEGDILTLYALCGFVCLLFVRWSPTTQMGVGITFYLVGAALFSAMSGFLYWVMNAGGAEAMAQADPNGATPAAIRAGTGGMEGATQSEIIQTSLIRSGDYAGFVQHNLTEHYAAPLSAFMTFGFETIPLMLIGMALYRMGLFDGRIAARRQALWGVAGVGLGGVATLALGLWALAAGLDFYTTFFAAFGLGAFARLPFIVGLAALFALWGPRATGWLGSRVSAAGRMAFSNYLGTSVLMLFVFHGFGLGLYGELMRPWLYIVMLLAWIVMLAWSKPWLSAFRFGPLEWLWRCLTYGKLYPIRRANAAA